MKAESNLVCNSLNVTLFFNTDFLFNDTVNERS